MYCNLALQQIVYYHNKEHSIIDMTWTRKINFHQLWVQQILSFTSSILRKNPFKGYNTRWMNFKHTYIETKKHKITDLICPYIKLKQ